MKYLPLDVKQQSINQSIYFLFNIFKYQLIVLYLEDMKIPVEKPEIIEVERNMVKLRWKPINVPSLYQVDDKYLRYLVETQTPPSKDWITLHRNIAGTVYVVSNLKQNQDYRFRIRASTRFGKISEPSPVAELIRNNGK